MILRWRTGLPSLTILFVGTIAYLGWRWFTGPAPEPENQQALQSPSEKLPERSAPEQFPRTWKLDYPRFFVSINDLATRVRQKAVPICPGIVQFLGEWPPKPAQMEETGHIQIKAQYGAKCDGFTLGYELEGEVPLSRYGQTRLSRSDFKAVTIRYTDDQLEADLRRDIPVEEIIGLLRRPENRVSEEHGFIIPGGELIECSVPLKVLMFRAAEAPSPLVALLDDPFISNEVVLALGAV